MFFPVKMATPRSVRCLGPYANWIADRHFCPREFLCDIARCGAFFITRHHEGLPYEMVRPLRPAGRVETGHIAEQRGRVIEAQGEAHIFRRLRIT
jgi:hypothetical protein